MSFTNITDEELVGKGVTGLPDTPGLSTEDMQAQFDEYPEFLKDKFRTLISELEAVTGALNIGAVVPENITADGNIQSILDGLRQYVDDTVIALGTGDMATGIYDPDRDGVIAPAQGGTGQNSLQAARNAMGLGNTLEALPIANGGTGQTTVEGVRSVLGLGNTQGALPIANGGTGASTVEGARNALGLGNTSGALPIENGGTGQTTAAAARNALGLGNTTGALPVANGGTGANSAESARANLGLGSAATENVMPIEKGGTGTNDGTLNGVKLAINGTTRGYYDANGNFKSFRQPTGNAAAGDVLSGKTFANSSNDAVTGTMPNRGSATRSINAGSSSTLDAGYYSGGTITANRYHNDNTYSYPQNSTGGTVDLGQGHDYRRVNAGNVYAKGNADGKAAKYPYNYSIEIYFVVLDTFNISLNLVLKQNGYTIISWNNIVLRDVTQHYWNWHANASYGGLTDAGYDPW